MNKHQIRVTGVLIEKNQILIVRQKVNPSRGWSLPGGCLERGETLLEAIVREMKEETGLDVSVRRLLYVADKPKDALLHITFELQREAGELQLPTNEFDSNPISDVKFVNIDELNNYGFSEKWSRIVESGFCDAPGYVGPKTNIGL